MKIYSESITKLPNTIERKFVSNYIRPNHTFRNIIKQAIEKVKELIKRCMKMEQHIVLILNVKKYD